ncbi:MAG: hypothetical protein AB7I30_14335 [Isosphaeraceae bacterium]
MPPITTRRAATVLAGLVAIALTAADEPKTQTISAGGLTFQAPADWKKAEKLDQMRQAQLGISPAEGDTYPGELVLFVFPGGAGGVEANVQRWRSQFRGEDGAPPKADVRTVPGQNVKVSRVEMAGDYSPPSFTGRPAQPRENARLLGAIVITEDAGYFLRLIGPDKTVKNISGEFDKLIASIKRVAN